MIVRDESGVAEVSNESPTWWHRPKKVVETRDEPWGNISKSQNIVAVITIYWDGMKEFGQGDGPFFLAVEVVDPAELSELECF